jgi:prephenate dehydrogenase
MEIQTVGIIGYGNFGKLVETLVKRFAPGITVRVYDPAHATSSALSEVASSDIVVLAVPIAAYESVITEILPHVRPDTVLVDIATVKVHTTSLLERLAPYQSRISAHPMFGPESYAKTDGDVRGFRIIMTGHTLNAVPYAALTEFLTTCGFSLVEMTPENHDRHLAESLFLTHFVGQIIHRAGFDRTEIDTVSFGHLMDAMEIVRHDAQLFRDVYRFDPYCREVLERFAIAERDVRALVEAV